MAQEPEFKINVVENKYFLDKTKIDEIIKIKTGRKFFYRLWFLISAPFVWLIRGEIKIR